MRVFPYLFCKKSEKKRKKSSKKKWPFLAFFKKFPYINLDFGPFLGGLKKAQLTFYSKRRYTYLCPGSVGYTFVFDLVSYGVLKFHLLMRSTFNFLVWGRLIFGDHTSTISTPSILYSVCRGQTPKFHIPTTF